MDKAKIGSKKDKKKNKSPKKEENEEQIRLELCKGTPVDYSYKKIKSLKDFNEDRPRAFRVKKTPDRSLNNRFLTCSLWLSNNRLIDIEGFPDFLSRTLEQPHLLGWLDLSSNFLTNIPSELTMYPNLRILYLHDNIIEKLYYVKRLIPLKKLYTLTLRGNPMEDEIHYKNYILYFLPQLKILDSVDILSCERLSPPPPKAILEEEEPVELPPTEQEMIDFIKNQNSDECENEHLEK